MKFTFFLLYFFYLLIVQGQYPEQQKQFGITFDTSGLEELITILEKEADRKTKENTLWSKHNNPGLLLADKYNAHSLSEIGPDNTPIYFGTLSRYGVYEKSMLGSTDYGIHELAKGENMTIGVWDEGLPLENHQEFDHRVQLGDSLFEKNSRHATITAGILIASGREQNAKGVLPMGSVTAYDWRNDRLEVARMAAKGLLISNHSYGILPENLPDWYFGAYLDASGKWDQIMYAAPYYLMVVAAGNSRTRGFNDSPLYGSASEGWDLLLGASLAKNGITVASAATKVGKMASAEVSDYSSLGPTDDGRIKPDLAFEGNGVYTTTGPKTADYGRVSGTSVAAAKVSGFLTLIQQYYFQNQQHFLKAATLKGLALHSATDVGTKGPDFKMGWGLLDPKRAIEVIGNKGYSTVIKEESLLEDQTFTYKVKANSLENLEVSISWTDPAYKGLYSDIKLNDPDAVLINDLDLRIIKIGAIYSPWILNFKSPNSPATKGDNNKDPYEKISIAKAEGEYIVQVTHKADLLGGMQDFSLIISGAELMDCTPNNPQNIYILDKTQSSLKLGWDNKGKDTSYEIKYTLKGLESWNTIFSDIPEIKITNLVPSREYELSIRSVCTKNINSERANVYSFQFLGQSTITLEPNNATTTFPDPIVYNYLSEKLVLNPLTPELSNYSIFDISGQLLKQGVLKGHEIGLDNIAAGYYILILDFKGIRTGLKFYHRTTGN